MACLLGPRRSTANQVAGFGDNDRLLDAREQRRRRVRTQRIISELASIKFGSSILGDQDSCSICLGEFERAQRLVLLKCNHAFHPECIESWLQIRCSCPLCVREVCEREPPRGAAVEMTNLLDEDLDFDIERMGD